MEELTDKQFKTRWTDIKKLIKQRPLLAYRVGIPLENWDTYMHSIPCTSEINRIYYAIQEDRKTKTLRLQQSLSKIVGYRESKEFSKKSGVSDTSIREIIEGKKTMVGYEVINKLELFLSAILPDFEVSIENPLTIKNYSQDYLGEIATDINQVADNLRYYCFKLSELARIQETEKSWNGEPILPTLRIQQSIETLSTIKDKIDLFWQIYIEKKA